MTKLGIFWLFTVVTGHADLLHTGLSLISAQKEASGELYISGILGTYGNRGRSINHFPLLSETCAEGAEKETREFLEEVEE